MTSKLLHNIFISYAKTIDRDSAIARYFFSKLVTQIVIEITSDCNRKCIYCPHVLTSRPNETMPDTVLYKILNDLYEINYSKNICLNLYNEPLLRFNHLIDKVTQIKAILPKSNVYFSSNGDALSIKRLQQLKNAGLNKIIITHHPEDASIWATEKIEKGIISQAKKLNTAIDRLIINKDKSVNLFAKLDTLEIEIFSLNFLTQGVNRAGSLEIVKNDGLLPRTRPCSRPLNDLCISYDGSVYPCCQFFHGLELHKKFCIGNVTRKNIFSIYYSTKMRTFRNMALKDGPKAFPCDTCAE